MCAATENQLLILNTVQQIQMHSENPASVDIFVADAA